MAEETPRRRTDAPARQTTGETTRRRTDAPALSISDPRALKALAHPARQRVVDLLYDHDVAITATQAAAACGLSPSAMSYHLRALERWGIVERDASASDGRERPWRAVGSSLNVGPSALTGVPVAEVATYLAAFLAPLNEAALRLASQLSEQPRDAPPHVSGVLSRGRLWLSPEEFAAVTDALAAVTQRFADRSIEDHPAHARPYDAYRILLPVDAATGAPEKNLGGDATAQPPQA